ncbi:MAG: hypothetical protein OXG25_01230, partial [Gammaproteobacteria bacterium]|nr:hypothetical protein [Gammaproteobacteria bacterium]
SGLKIRVSAVRFCPWPPEACLLSGTSGCRDTDSLAALIALLLQHCHIVIIRGNNYRMRARRYLPNARAPGRRY